MFKQYMYMCSDYSFEMNELYPLCSKLPEGVM